MSEPVQPTPGPNPTPIEPAAKVEPVAPVTLPEDHPLVKALAAQKDEIKRLKTVVDGSKTEAEKVADKLAEYEQKVIAAEARTARREVALEHHLTTEDAALLDTVTDGAAMRALAERMARNADTAKRGTNYVPGEGKTQEVKGDDRRAFLRTLTGRD